jgi:hypothetical protein
VIDVINADEVKAWKEKMAKVIGAQDGDSQIDPDESSNQFIHKIIF